MQTMLPFLPLSWFHWLVTDEKMTTVIIGVTEAYNLIRYHIFSLVYALISLRAMSASYSLQTVFGPGLRDSQLVCDRYTVLGADMHVNVFQYVINFLFATTLRSW